MVIDKNTKQVMLGNTEIKRIMSGGGILWQKIYKWKKYDLGAPTELGYVNRRLTPEELRDRFPKYFDFTFNPTGFGTYTLYGRLGYYEGIVESQDNYAFPDNDMLGGYYYERIN